MDREELMLPRGGLTPDQGEWMPQKEELMLREEGLAGRIRETFRLQERNYDAYSPLTFAFVGDVVFELIVRTKVAEEANRSVKQLNKEKVGVVNAAAQARLIEEIFPFLNEKEKEIYKRGRNARTASPAKNQSLSDYHKATGFEALCGYLYLTGAMERLLFLLAGRI